MRDFGNGWSGLKDYAVKVGVATADDGDDAVAAKIKAVIQGTLPETGETPEKEPAGAGPQTMMGKAAAAVGLGDDG